MARPDPHLISRRPMATGQTAVAYRAGRAGPAVAVLAAGRLDPDALYRALEDAEVAVEGATYDEPALFLGSATLVAQVQDAAEVALMLEDNSDRRARDVVAARVAREVARLMGAGAPSAV